MSQIINIYCDESCHLLLGDHRAMVIGAIWCPANISRIIADQIRAIKEEHGLNRYAEIKWRGVSPSKLDFFLALVEYFKITPALFFRAVVIPDKSILRHDDFDQTHDDFYYKIYFRMLEHIITQPDNHYRVFVDIKDTRSEDKIRKLRDCLAYNIRDFDKKVIEIQSVRSHEIQQVQLADLFIGAVSFANSFMKFDRERSSAKWTVIDKIGNDLRVSLAKTSPIEQMKFNILHWRPKGAPDV